MNHTNLSRHTTHLIYGSLFFLILLITIGIYWSGLYGTYLLDDSPNLEDLETVDSSHFYSVTQFVTEGIASNLGRPLSLLTFALQAHQWPGNPFGFKYINLMIHLLNGCLIFWLLIRITRLTNLSETRGLIISLLISSLWLLHPLQVSTVLYVIQRMTQLSAFFTVAALLAYVIGRESLVRGHLKTGYLWTSLGIGLGGIFAVLSKENGILLIFYLLALELTVFNHLTKPRYWQLWKSLFIYIPIAALVLYFATHMDIVQRSYEIREFTMGERLLTQTRVLSDYLGKILLPRTNTYGLFQDDFPISKNVFTPLSTLFTLAFIITILTLALWLRRLYPIFALGVLWFLAGHLLESTFIGLVIYFEHRNYLALLGVLCICVYGILCLIDRLTAHLRNIILSSSVVFFLLFPLVTWTQTQLWANPLIQAVRWADDKPLSRYAQSHAASVFAKINMAKTMEYVRYMVNAFPQDNGPYLLWLSAVCMDNTVELPEMTLVLNKVAQARTDTATTSALNVIIGRYMVNDCPRLPIATLHQIFETVLRNPSGSTFKNDLYFIYAKLLASEKNFDKAIEMADKAITKGGPPHMRMQRLLWLSNAHRYAEGLAYAQTMRSEINFLSRFLYAEQLDALESLMRKLNQINQEVEKKGSTLEIK